MVDFCLSYGVLLTYSFGCNSILLSFNEYLIIKQRGVSVAYLFCFNMKKRILTRQTGVSVLPLQNPPYTNKDRQLTVSMKIYKPSSTQVQNIIIIP